VADIAQEYLDLLERPVFAHLGTVRPDGSPQVNPMWFAWNGSALLFTHTSSRQKYRNITHDPRVSVCLTDPENPFRYLELRGTVTAVRPDPTGAFYVELAARYGQPTAPPPADAAERVILEVAIERARGR